MMTSGRNPLVDPQPGDAVQAKGYEFDVHFVSNRKVYCGRSVDSNGHRCISVTLEIWRKDCADAGAVVVRTAQT